MEYDRGSLVINDPKGEIFRATFKKRLAMGQRVVVLDPFHVVTTTPDTYNPLDVVPPLPEGVDDLRGLSEAMFPVDHEDKQRHWRDQGANSVTSALTYVRMLEAEDRNFASLRQIITRRECSRPLARSW